jgi:beclin 1
VKDLLEKFKEEEEEDSSQRDGEGSGSGAAVTTAATSSSSSGDRDEVKAEEKFLCGDCALMLQSEMERMIAECEMDCQAYQKALKKLEKETQQDTGGANTSASGVPMSEESFQREIAKYKEEEQREESRVADLQAKLKQLNAEREGLDTEAEDLDKIEQRYWKQFNHYKLEMDAFSEEKEALVSKIESASCQLELLKRTNIYNDVFHIWHDGPFGTINSFRMGKTNKIQVEWDEINAAWGQAVLLLHTMSSSCDEFEFSEKKLIPMGSYPKISDGKNTYELYGPVTQFLRANYDKAMCIFLQCLQEFSIYAKQYDIAHQTKPPFQLPYKIEGDKICGHTVRLRFNVNDKWTKALKYMLANLKVTLVWLTSSGPVGAAGREKVMGN